MLQSFSLALGILYLRGLWSDQLGALLLFPQFSSECKCGSKLTDKSFLSILVLSVVLKRIMETPQPNRYLHQLYLQTADLDSVLRREVDWFVYSSPNLWLCVLVSLPYLWLCALVCWVLLHNTLCQVFPSDYSPH